MTSVNPNVLQNNGWLLLLSGNKSASVSDFGPYEIQKIDYSGSAYTSLERANYTGSTMPRGMVTLEIMGKASALLTPSTDKIKCNPLHNTKCDCMSAKKI